MRVVDLPVRLGRTLYEEAIERYGALTSSRMSALYVVGNITYPGLSDLDLLLVVPVNEKKDNEYFFSVFNRLPNRYRPLFLHQPFIVPEHLISVLEFTTHSRACLVRGADVLGSIDHVDSIEERWCKLFEGYCTYERYFDGARRSDAIHGRDMIAVASSMRFTLRECDALLGTTLAPPYVAVLDEVRSTFFERDGVRAIMRVWRSFNEAFDTLTGNLTALLPADAAGVGEFARRVCRGESTFDGVSRSYASLRSQAIDEHNDALRAMRLSYGHLFFLAAHGGRSTCYRHGKVARGIFRLRRLSGQLYERLSTQS